MVQRNANLRCITIARLWCENVWLIALISATDSSGLGVLRLVVQLTAAVPIGAGAAGHILILCGGDNNICGVWAVALI